MYVYTLNFMEKQTLFKSQNSNLPIFQMEKFKL